MEFITVGTHLDKRTANKNGLHPVKLRLIRNRDVRYYRTKYYLSPEDYKKMYSKRPGDPLKEIRIDLDKELDKAKKAISKMGDGFTFESFKREFYQPQVKEAITIFFDRYIKELKKDGRISTAYSYQNARESLKKYKKVMMFNNITPAFLRNYEKWMYEKGNSPTTVGIYLRNLRTLFNDAITAKIVSREIYPFGSTRKGLYEIPTGKNTKKALTLAQITEIYNYSTKPYTTLDMVKDYWMFLYLANGMNVKDMALLKYKNVDGNVIEFVRAKTVRTKREVEPIRVPIYDETKSIIQKWGQPAKSKETYIFPILKQRLSPEREWQLIQQLIHVINENLKTIGEDLGIPQLTTYVARHSYASGLMASGASLELIRSGMGHASAKTTQNYIASIENDVRRETQRKLIPLKSK